MTHPIVLGNRTIIASIYILSPFALTLKLSLHYPHHPHIIPLNFRNLLSYPSILSNPLQWLSPEAERWLANALPSTARRPSTVWRTTSRTQFSNRRLHLLVDLWHGNTMKRANSTQFLRSSISVHPKSSTTTKRNVAVIAREGGSSDW